MTSWPQAFGILLLCAFSFGSCVPDRRGQALEVVVSLGYDTTGFGYYRALTNGDSLAVGGFLTLFPDPDTIHGSGQRPVHAAVASGEPSLLRLLRTAGADFEAVNQEGLRPIHLAAQSGSAEMVRGLAQVGVDLNAPTDLGEAAVALAKRGDHQEVLNALREAGARFTGRINVKVLPGDEDWPRGDPLPLANFKVEVLRNSVDPPSWPPGLIPLEQLKGSVWASLLELEELSSTLVPEELLQLAKRTVEVTRVLAEGESRPGDQFQLNQIRTRDLHWLQEHLEVYRLRRARLGFYWNEAFESSQADIQRLPNRFAGGPESGINGDSPSRVQLDVSPDGTGMPALDLGKWTIAAHIPVSPGKVLTWRLPISVLLEETTTVCLYLEEAEHFFGLVDPATPLLQDLVVGSIAESGGPGSPFPSGEATHLDGPGC